MRRGAGAVAGEGEEGLDSLLRRRGASLIGSINNISVASAITGRTRTDDFLDAEMGKHDYDWLLTPPATPNFSSSGANESQPTSTTIQNRSTLKSASTARASRLSLSQSEDGNSTRPMRSSSVNRPSLPSTHSNSLSNNRILPSKTSTASVTSRSSTPSRTSNNRSRPGTVSSARASAVSRPVQARSVNPAKTRPSLTSTSEKRRPLQSSRPSTPTGRPQIPSISGTILNSSTVRSTSRQSTPTCRPKTPVPSSSPASVAGRSPSAGRLPACRNTGPGLRPNSPGHQRARNPVSLIDPTLYSSEAPPNLRTKLPEKPASASKTRPGMALTVRASSNTKVPASNGSGQMHLLPAVGTNKLSDNLVKLQFSKTDHDPVLQEIQKQVDREPGVRRASKVGLTESNGFGRTISKMSLDMALKHMDIRQSIGGIRANMIFPHSIRSENGSKSRSVHVAEPIIPPRNGDGFPTEAERSNITPSENEKPTNKDGLMIEGNDLDLYGSSRYDTLLLKEDSTNTNWLHSIEDKSDQSPMFDRRFDPPPEPFSPL